MGIEYLAAEGGIALLDVNPGLVIWTTFTFLLVLVTLTYFAWKPITMALDTRADRIQGDLNRAEAIRNEAEAKLNEYIEKIGGLQAEGQEIVSSAKLESEKLKNEILESARKEAEEIKNSGMRDVKHAMDRAVQDFHRQVTEISIQVAGQILGKSLSADDHKRLIEESIEKMGSVN